MGVNRHARERRADTVGLDALGRACLLLVLLVASSARGEVIRYTDFDQWSQAVPSHTTLDFTGFPFGTIITTQYSHLGATFTDGDDNVVGPTFTYPQDMWGLRGQNGGAGDIDISFATLQYAIGVHFPGTMAIELMREGQVIHATSHFDNVVSTFGGVVSTEPFDAVRIIDPLDASVFVDNIYFAVPGPGALGVFALAGLCIGSRRRTR